MLRPAARSAETVGRNGVAMHPFLGQDGCPSVKEDATRSYNDDRARWKASDAAANRVMVTAKMFLVILLPISMLISVTVVIMVDTLDNYDDTRKASRNLDHALRMASLATVLQKERGMSTLFLRNDDNDGRISEKLERIKEDVAAQLDSMSDSSISGVGDSRYHTSGGFVRYLEEHRTRVAAKDVAVLANIRFYTNLTLQFIGETLSNVGFRFHNDMWKMFFSLESLLRAADAIGIQRALGAGFYASGGMSDVERQYFIRLESQFQLFLQQSFIYDAQFRTRYDEGIQRLRVLESAMNNGKRTVMYPDDRTKIPVAERVDAGFAWFDNVTDFISFLETLKDGLAGDIRADLATTMTAKKHDVMLYCGMTVTIVVTCIVLCVWYASRIHAITGKLRTYGLRMVAKTKELATEKHRTDVLLCQMLPTKVVDQLKRNARVAPEFYEAVTIYFSDVVDFSRISASSSPQQVVSLLSKLYRWATVAYGGEGWGVVSPRRRTHGGRQI